MEILVLGLALLCLGCFLGALLVIGLFKALLFLILLPFRLVGALFTGVGVVAGGIFKLIGGLASVVVAIVVTVALLIAVPLVPLLLLAAAGWMLLRWMRPRPAAAV